MDLYKSLNEIETLVGEAKWNLVQSRVYEQEAIIHDELDALYGPNHLPYNMGDACRRMAKACRLLAREQLKEVEVLNGKLYLDGKWTVRLRDALNCRGFRYWPAYAAVYKTSSLLKGVDPA